MSLASIILRAAEEGGEHIVVDDKGYITTHSWILPENFELIYGGIASLLIFGALYKFAGPALKKGMAARTARIQAELDGAAKAKADATAEAERIRSAKGDIEGERSRLIGDAEDEARRMLAEGRQRIAAEAAEAEAKAEADLAQMGGRANDELRAEIARRSAEAADVLVAETLDEATHQQLIESFIAKVGAGK